MTVLSVTQVNTYIKALLDEAMPLRSIYISGEISNFLHYYKSGHMYFTLKDEKSQIKAVMFASYSEKLKFTPTAGMKVICYGRVSTYEKDGVYQLYVQDMQPQGIGSLTIAFEQLKAKLNEEGLFDERYKKPIPKYPTKIGVATSNMGAAVQDIKNVLGRRYPLAGVVIVPTVVQGEFASDDIAKAIHFLDCLDGIDVIIVGRGGGSIEDLWAFNTEVVARAVFNCKTPVISAVGHETDFTICDFVADLRAPTPSAAAELAVPDIANERVLINNFSLSLEKSIDYVINKEEQRLKNIKENSPLADATKIFDNLQSNINLIYQNIQNNYSNIINAKESKFAKSVAKLDALSPLSVLSRGYSIATKNNIAIKNSNDLSVGDEINIRFADGNAKANISEVINDD